MFSVARYEVSSLLKTAGNYISKRALCQRNIQEFCRVAERIAKNRSISTTSVDKERKGLQPGSDLKGKRKSSKEVVFGVVIFALTVHQFHKYVEDIIARRNSNENENISASGAKPSSH